MSTMATFKSESLHNYHPSMPNKTTPISLSFTPTFIFLRKSPVAAKLKAKHSLDRQTSLRNSEEAKVISNQGVVGSVGVVVAAAIAVLIISNGDDKAWALGPEGPLVEEFWENIRRYGLYALTVSTGVLYAVFQPIFELLKNPISALLVLIIIGGSIFIVSQILSAMVGVSDFSYQYTY